MLSKLISRARRTSKRRKLALAIVTASAFGGLAASQLASADSNVIRAHAIITGTSLSGDPISGRVRFTQSPADANLPEPTVDVVARVEGLTPGLHGFHIHEFGICTPPTFASAGGHFDPGPNGNSNTDFNHPFHAGDLPNLEVNNAGVGELRTTTSRITLDAAESVPTTGPGHPLGIFDADGSTIIVHQNRDQGNPTYPVPNAPGSGVSGGVRIACGVIQLTEPTTP